MSLFDYTSLLVEAAEGERVGMMKKRAVPYLNDECVSPPVAVQPSAKAGRRPRAVSS